MSWQNHEKFTITIDSRVCRLISEGLKLLKKSGMYDCQPYEWWIKLNQESFYNLSNHKVAEVTEVAMLNPMAINVIKREIIKP